MTADPSSWQGAIFGYNHSLAARLRSAGSCARERLQHAGSRHTGRRRRGRSGDADRAGPIKVLAASGDPAGPAALARGQPAFVAATVLSDATGAWGDDLTLSSDSYAELSPGLSGGRVTKQTADMLDDLPYMTALQVLNPANGRSMILYKRDIGAGRPLSQTLRGYHYRIAVTQAAETQLGVSGSAIVQVTLLAGPVDGPGAARACIAPIVPGAYANPFAHATGIVPQRIDQGVDYDGTGPIAAIGDATGGTSTTHPDTTDRPSATTRDRSHRTAVRPTIAPG
jgi:hypothetical protein